MLLNPRSTGLRLRKSSPKAFAEFVSGKVALELHNPYPIMVQKLIKYLGIRLCLKMHLFKFR